MLKAGFYEKEITPPLGYAIPGYYSKRLGDGVHDRLYAKAVAIEKDGNTVISISLDGIATSTRMCEPILERITDFTKIPKENVMISATHTHTGMPRMVDGGDETEYEAYFHILRCLMADAAILAYQRMEPCKIKYASSIEKGLTFNRNYLMKDGTARTNPGIGNPEIERVFGEVDEEFSTLFFFDSEDKPMGAIMNFACHHDSTLTKWGCNLSADYSGVLSGIMKEEFGDGFVTAFLSGANGNLNALDVNRGSKVFDRPLCLDIGEALAKAALLHIKEAKELKVDKVESIKEYIDIKRQEFSKEELEEAEYLIKTYPSANMGVDISKPDSIEFKRMNAEIILKKASMPPLIPVCIQTIRIGDAMIFGLLGEPYTEYGLMLKEKSPAKITMVATMANGGRNCYLPTKEAFGTMIYEVQPNSRVLCEEAGEEIVEHALSQAERLSK